jgi:prolyl-tRNA synthetase
MGALKNSRIENFSEWYQELLSKAELSENGPVRGTMVIRPYAYGIWEHMQREVNDRIQRAGAQNAYFPLFIPMSYFEREAEHIEGFSPELAVVTHGGGKALDEPIVIRPTSETIIGEYMAKWVQSYRDLPLLLNQWANVVRWEKRPRVFLRTTEFLWQEGHTAHRTEEEAAAYASKILFDVYEDFMVNELAIDVLPGRKPSSERFAGATNSLTVEAMMGDGKALQMGTSHELGQNFAKASDIRFSDEDGQERFAWTASWGVSTRMMGGLIMVHGDDAGLRVPPRVAPIQVIVISTNDDAAVREQADRVALELRSSGVRVQQDDRLEKGLGRRITDWELKGVPVRIQVGPREVESGRVSVARRDTGDRSSVPLAGLPKAVISLLDAIQLEMLDQSRLLRAARTRAVDSIGDAIEAASGGWATMPWSEVREHEERLKEKAITVRCLINEDGSLPTDDEEQGSIAVIGKSY